MGDPLGGEGDGEEDQNEDRGRKAGLSAAVLLVVLFTISMGAQAYRHLFKEGAGRRASGRVA